MIRYNIALIAILCFACIAQQFVPSITGLFDVRVLLVPIVFLCCSLTGGTPMMLLLAFIGGFLWDCQNTLAPQAGDPSLYTEKISSLRFGYSIILYAVMGAALLGFRPLFQNGKWHIPTAIAGVSIYAYLWVEYLLINIIRGDFAVNEGIFFKVTLTAILTTLLAPVLLLGLSKLALACNHAIKNDNRRRFFSPDRV